MTGAAFRLGIPPDLAPRLPVALMAVGFLAFYWWILRREFGARAAWFATLILGCCGGWLVYSQVGVPDMPVAAAFSAAMLLALPWIGRRDTRNLPVAAALLGLAVLAKGPVALVLAAPLCLRFRSARDLVRPRVVAPFLVVALPWYLLCYLRNGKVFLHDFFLVHNFERFTSNALMHAQPWWFYLPVLAGLLLPWFPLVVLPGRRAAYRDSRRLFLLAWVVFGMVFFTAATNKLPGYLLPLLPAAAALMGLALDAAEAAHAAPWLACCALLLVAFPMAARMLLAALAAGLSKAPLPAFQATWLLAGRGAADRRRKCLSAASVRGRSRLSNWWPRASPTKRSPTFSISASRPWNPTGPTSWRNSGFIPSPNWCVMPSATTLWRAEDTGWQAKAPNAT
jgi:4-amino-4-deoxy-L-arabinose transferase-like glycosyltransferase